MYTYQKINLVHIFPIFAKLRIYWRCLEYIKLCNRSSAVYVIMYDKTSADVVALLVLARKVPYG